MDEDRVEERLRLGLKPNRTGGSPWSARLD